VRELAHRWGLRRIVLSAEQRRAVAAESIARRFADAIREDVVDEVVAGIAANGRSS
jgi:hypothetical protein